MIVKKKKRFSVRFDVQMNTRDIRMKLNIYSTTCKVQCDSAESQDWQINMSAVIIYDSEWLWRSPVVWVEIVQYYEDYILHLFNE